MKRVSLHIFFSVLMLILAATQGFSQISVNTANFVYLQNFDGYTGTNINTVPQWAANGSFTYRGVGNGSSNTGGAWAYGTGSGASSERALGYLGSGTSSSISYGISFVNNTGSPVTHLEISYNFEQWRFESGNTLGWNVQGTGALSAVSVSGLNSNSVMGNSSGTVQMTPKAIVLTGLNILPNATFGLQWSCSNGAGNDNGVAIDNFRLAVICAPKFVSVDTTLCAGAAFVVNGNTYTTPQVVSDTLLAANGCDSIVSYDLNFLPAITHSFSDTACFGTTYSWGNQNLTASGSYNQTFTSATSCDSVVTLNLFVLPAITYSFADTVCAATNYSFGNQNLTASGSYNQTFTSVTSCDSVVTLNLFVRPAITYSFADTICAATNYSFGIQNLTASGSYNQTFTSVANCDSVVTLNLFVRPAITYSFADTVCAATNYSFGSQNLTASGSYNQTFTSVTSCDSVVTLNLFVRQAITYSFADTVCAAANYSWGSQNLTASGSYNHTFTSVTSCDSVVTLNLFVRPAITHSFADTVCAAANYSFGSQNLTASGSYNQTFTSVANCDSVVTLNLFIRPAITYSFADTVCAAANYSFGSQNLTASGSYNHTFTSATSCDSVVTLNLFVRPAITYSFADTICAATNYSFGNQSLTASGSYNQTFTSATSCDSVVTLNLFVRPAITYSFADTVCAAANYSFGNQNLTASGSYNHTFTSVTNCDSVVTLNLFVRPAITYSFADTVCAATNYSFGSQNLTASGSYSQTFTSATSCDSVVTLNLFVRPANNTTISQSICSGTSYSFGSQLLTTSGVYTGSFQAINGCDSNVTLTLNVGSLITNSIADTVCAAATYSWGSQSLTASGSYNQTFTSATSCDSVVTLNLFVRPAITYSFADTICTTVTYSWGSQSLTASGSYNQTFSAFTGCDSIVTLNLFVRPATTYSFADTICAAATYNWGSLNLTASGSYNQTFPTANGCDSLVILYLNVRSLIMDTVQASICYGSTYILGSQNLSASGYYSAIFTSATNCDSMVTLHLQVNPQPATVIIDTAACETVWFEGVPYTSSTTLTDTLSTALGCDSIYRIVHIAPHANNPVVQTIDTVSCGPLVYNGNVYTESISLSDTLVNALGCDSFIRVVNIKISKPETQTLVHEMCAGNTFTFNGQQYNTAGSYPFSFKNQAGCDSVITLELSINPLPQVEITVDANRNYCAGDSLMLQGAGAQFYSWIYQDVDTFEGDYFRTLLFHYKNDFLLTGTDNNGCSNSTSIHIDAQACCNLWMPNAFSPNGDGTNDIFKPEGAGHPKEYAMRIYNRWGETVFTTFDLAKGWDGYINGKPADLADYYYRVSGKCVNGEAIDLKGPCTLIR
jgi:gliding motility-associated-like protein